MASSSGSTWRGSTAIFVRGYASPGGLLSGSQGDVQYLPAGHVFLGWGANPYFTEYDADGYVIFDAHFMAGADTYRAFRFRWIGHPTDRPALAVETDRKGRVTAYASWNGATEVAGWQALVGPDLQHLGPVATVPRSGFETAIDLAYTTGHYVAVRALDADGRVLGESFAKKRPPR